MDLSRRGRRSPAPDHRWGGSARPRRCSRAVGDASERQQTLRATIEWCYELLSAGTSSASSLELSVFVGGSTLDAAGTVCAADLDAGIAGRPGLLRRQQVSGGEPRLSILETIRGFAPDGAARLPVPAERSSPRRVVRAARRAPVTADAGSGTGSTARLIEDFKTLAVLERQLQAVRRDPGSRSYGHFRISGSRADCVPRPFDRRSRWSPRLTNFRLRASLRAFRGERGLSGVWRCRVGRATEARADSSVPTARFDELVAATLANLADMASARGDFAGARRWLRKRSRSGEPSAPTMGSRTRTPAARWSSSRRRPCAGADVLQRCLRFDERSSCRRWCGSPFLIVSKCAHQIGRLQTADLTDGCEPWRWCASSATRVPNAELPQEFGFHRTTARRRCTAARCRRLFRPY